MQPATLDDLTKIKGIGPAMAEKLSRLGINSITDLFFHLPLRYEDRSRVVRISQLRNGMRAAIEGEITSASIQYGKRRSLVCKLKDESGSISLRFFYFSAAQQKQFAPGTTLRCFGEVSLTKQGLTLIHPECELNPIPLSNEPRLTAIYPSTEGIQQVRWRSYLDQAFKLAKGQQLEDLLQPQDFAEQFPGAQISLIEAIEQLHFPATSVDLAQLEQGLHPAQQRLAFEELVAFRVSYARIKQRYRANIAPPLDADNTLQQQFLSSLPFELTAAQQRVLKEVCQDMRQSQAMLRLVQGDVGSGKTVVAALAALQSIESQHQAALMAPTEILAEQHFQTFSQWFDQAGLTAQGIRVELLVSAMGSAEKRCVLQALQDGSCALVIGTHALVQDAVVFANLGLAIIDEQHRFGVEQRKTLVEKRHDERYLHQLVMTATPIPRTLAMTFYADMDYSVIDELPPGRKPVSTVVLSNSKRDSVIERIQAACQQGRQVYWVCTLVEESELLAAQAAETTFDALQKALPALNLALVHGRLAAPEKQRIMQQFKTGKTQLLVATTVIEVGVDVPNASLMIIENAERLGLAQLHQLRGRVGRGSAESHCVLMYQTPLSHNGRRRLDIMRETNDGFRIAEEDLRIRGPGEVLGTRQSGAMSMRIADLERDAAMIEPVVKTAERIAKDEQRCQRLTERWCRGVADYSSI